MAQQLALDLPHRPALDRGSFLIGESNREAVAWIDRWPDWPAAGLIVYGAAGSGKSHLAAVWQLTAAARLRDAARASDLEFDDLAARPAAVIERADACQDPVALLHLYNAIAEAGGHVLLLGRGPPARWPAALADLRSRLLALPAVAVRAPDDGVLIGVMAKLARDRQLHLTPAVLDYLAPRMERSFAAAGALIAWLDRESLRRGRPLTVPLARAALAACASEPDSLAASETE